MSFVDGNQGGRYQQPGLDDFKTAADQVARGNEPVKVDNQGQVGVVSIGGKVWARKGNYDPEIQKEILRAIAGFERSMRESPSQVLARKAFDRVVGDQIRRRPLEPLRVGQIRNSLALVHHVRDFINATGRAGSDDQIKFSKTGDIQVVPASNDQPTDREVTGSRRAISLFRDIVSREHGEEKANQAFVRAGINEAEANGFSVGDMQAIFKELRTVDNIRHIVCVQGLGLGDRIKFDKFGKLEIVPDWDKRATQELRPKHRSAAYAEMLRTASNEYGSSIARRAFEMSLGSDIQRFELGESSLKVKHVRLILNRLNYLADITPKIAAANEDWRQLPLDSSTRVPGQPEGAPDRPEGTQARGRTVRFDDDRNEVRNFEPE